MQVVNKSALTKKFFQWAFLLFLGIFGESFAANVSAMNPDSLVRALRNAGYKASLTRTPEGDPVIDTSTQGSAVRIILTKYGNDHRAAEFVGYWDCRGRMKECIRNAQKFNDEESPAKAIPFVSLDQTGVCYYALYDAAGTSESLFIANLEVFAFYNQKFSKLFDEKKAE